jgi:hypothetical protein
VSGIIPPTTIAKNLEDCSEDMLATKLNVAGATYATSRLIISRILIRIAKPTVVDFHGRFLKTDIDIAAHPPWQEDQ